MSLKDLLWVFITYLEINSLTALQVSCKQTVVTKRLEAAKTIAKLVTRAVRNQWINSVVSDAVSFHAFPHRLCVNVATIASHFGGGIDAISRIQSTRNFAKLRWQLCPKCRVSNICGALFYAEGRKLLRSTPHLIFGCQRCLENAEVPDNSAQDAIYTLQRLHGWVPQFYFGRQRSTISQLVTHRVSA